MTALHEAMSWQPATSNRTGADETALSPVPVRFPGRWIGGAVGAIASFLVGAALWAVTHVRGPAVASSDGGPFGAAPFIAFLGIPIAFVLGRHLAPTAKGDGWRSAAAAAVTFALLAPPLGDIEIIGGLGLAPWTSAATAGIFEAFAGGIFIGGIGLAFSYVALPVTAAVAVVWILLMRLVPETLPARFKTSARIARFGVRHVVYVALAWIVAAWTVWTVVRPPMPSPWA